MKNNNIFLGEQNMANGDIIFEQGGERETFQHI